MGITLSPWMMAFLVLMTGFAGFVDSAAGGGGLISLPAYLFAGLPPHYTYATNKFSAACGTTFATANFFKNGAMNLKVGISSQAPQKGVCVSEFSELRLSTETVGDFRMGE